MISILVKELQAELSEAIANGDSNAEIVIRMELNDLLDEQESLDC